MSDRTIDDEITTVKSIGDGIRRLLEWFETRKNRKTNETTAAIHAIVNAAAETKNYATALTASSDKRDVPDRADELSELWKKAGALVAVIDSDLATHCDVKAYGWKTRWVSEEAYQHLIKNVDDIFDRAIALRRELKE